MRELDPKWETFYDEIDYEKRLDALKEIEDSAPLNEQEQYAKHLFETRFEEDGKVDTFMRSLLDNMYIYRFRGTRNHMRKTALEVQKNLFTFDAKEKGEPYEDFLYWELRNVAKRYLSTQHDPSYNKKLFGTITSSIEERALAIVIDLLEISYGVALKTDATEDMKLYCEALEDAIRVESPAMIEHLPTMKEKIEQEVKKKRFLFF